MHGHVDADEFAHHQRVVRRAIERRVAGHGGDTQQLAEASGNDDGDGVVVPGIAVEDDGGALGAMVR